MTPPSEATEKSPNKSNEPGGLAPDRPLSDDIRADIARDLRAQAARNDVAERRRITQKLRTALAEDGFVLHYQPKVHLKTGRVRGVEAVIRLLHRRRGLILPAHFMPVAERSDIVIDIGAWALNEACREATRWPERFTVSLNISHRQLRSNRLTKQIIEALHGTGLAAARLELEVSEAMLIDDNEDASFGLKAARGLGVGVALDDFGAGYGSLSVLRRLPLTTLKLDRSVILGLQNGDHDAVILRAAIEAAHALGCTVVADGVETETQCRMLDQMGCDEAQGSYFSPALPASELLSRLTA
jgi:EAL domain-containing protein (putative c-di-GMP-specific phosphodiesterase class I)